MFDRLCWLKHPWMGQRPTCGPPGIASKRWDYDQICVNLDIYGRIARLKAAWKTYILTKINRKGPLKGRPLLPAAQTPPWTASADFKPNTKFLRVSVGHHPSLIILTLCDVLGRWEHIVASALIVKIWGAKIKDGQWSSVEILSGLYWGAELVNKAYMEKLIGDFKWTSI